MVRENQSIRDMDVIIETPVYKILDEHLEVPTVVGEEQIITTRSTIGKRRRVREEVSDHYLSIATNLVKKEDFSKFVLPGKIDGQKDRYRCLFCTKVFNYVSRLKLHLRVHTGEKPYACSMCDFTASYKKSVEVHMRSHTGEKPYACSICDFRAARKANVDDHMRVHTGEKPFACPLCDFRSAQQSAVTCHLKRHTGEKKFVCNICSFRTAYKHILQAHHRVHTGERPFSCSLCSYRGSTKLNVRLHMRRHTGEKPYACSMCDFRSTKRYSVKLHMRRHTGEKPFKCQYCDYSAAQKFCLMQHLKKHEDGCNEPSYKPLINKQLKARSKRHYFMKGTSCPECGLTFVNNTRLMDHMALAHDYFSQQTIQEICNGISEFEELSVYDTDIKMDPVPVTYSCASCDYCTESKKSFDTHTHDLLHFCKVCNKKFSNKAKMQDHLALHPGGKKRMFVCPFCTTLFNVRSDIIKHLNVAHTLLGANSSNHEIDEVEETVKSIVIKEELINTSPEGSIDYDYVTDSEDDSNSYRENILFGVEDNDENFDYKNKIKSEFPSHDDVSGANNVRSVVFRSDNGTIMTTRRVVVGKGIKESA